MNFLIIILLALYGCIDIEGPITFDNPIVPEETLSVVVIEIDRIFIEHPPTLVAGGNEDFVYRNSIKVNVENRTIREVFSFHGIDKNDQVEMDTNIYLDGVPILLRSDHGLDDDNDAWSPPKDINRSGNIVVIDVLCRVTGVNKTLNRLAARPHWGIWLTFE